MKILNFIYSKTYFLIYVFIILYTLAAIVVSVNRYWQFQNFYFDFGIFDTAIWKVSRFELPILDHVDLGDKEYLIFATHFNPSIFLLSPVFWLTSRSEVLLIIQSVAVGISAVIAYLIARKKIKSFLAIFALIFAYLGYVGLQNALISDFHEATIAVLPLMLIFWSIINNKWKLYFVLLIILLGLKESFAGLGVGLGLYLIIQDKKNLKVGLVTILLSIIWGILTVFVIIPHFSSGVYLYTAKHWPGNLQEVIYSFIYPDSRWKTIFYTYATFGFLPIFNLAIFPAVFENFFERFILGGGRGEDLGMHYNAWLSPLMFMGALNVLIWMENKGRAIKRLIFLYSVITILIVVFLHRVELRGPLGLVYNPVFYEQNSHVEYVNRFVEKFPESGLIMTQNDLAVRLTHQDVKLLREDYKTVNPDYIILNLTPGQNPNSFFPLSFEKVQNLKNTVIQDKLYKLEKFGDELYLFSKINQKVYD